MPRPPPVLSLVLSLSKGRVLSLSKGRVEGPRRMKTSPPCPPLLAGEGEVRFPLPSQGGGWGVGAIFRAGLMMSAPLLPESWVVAALGLAVLSGVVGAIAKATSVVLAMAGKAFGDIPLLTHAISEP